MAEGEVARIRAKLGMVLAGTVTHEEVIFWGVPTAFAGELGLSCDVCNETEVIVEIKFPIAEIGSITTIYLDIQTGGVERGLYICSGIIIGSLINFDSDLSAFGGRGCCCHHSRRKNGE